MARPNRLSAPFVKSITHTGKTRSGERHGDGNGLSLCVQPSGSKSWVQRLVIHGRQRSFGLGAFPLVSLKEARELAFENRRLARRGDDPLARRRSIPNFATAAATVIDIRAGAWRDAHKSRRQWTSSLTNYAFPRFGATRVDMITSEDVMAVLLPIWTAKNATAQRVRQRISAVMRWCVAQRYRSDDCAGEAVLQALPKRVGLTAQRHHQAVPYDAVGDTVRRIRESQAWAGTKLGFEFLILTACRSGEVRGARWDEMDVAGATWTIPAGRMKAGVEHRVPLQARCVEILTEAKDLADMIAPRPTGNLVFPTSRGKIQQTGAMSRLLHALGEKGVPHGFRSTFRDWASEKTDAPHAVMEAALAHVVPNSVERAYARSDLLALRRDLMERWAAHVCGSPTDH